MRASFLKRFAASVYDLLLACSVFLLSGFLAVIVFMVAVETGLVGQVHDFSLLNTQPELYQVFLVWVRLCTFGSIIFFYIWFWEQGQTLGMKAWKLELRCLKGQHLSKRRVFVRLCWSLFGFSNVLVLFRHDKLALQDRMTSTEIIQH